MTPLIKNENKAYSKDEYQQIRKIIEEELRDHQIIQSNIKKKGDQGKNAKTEKGKESTEELLLILIIIASVVGSMALTSITCYVINKKRKKSR